MKKKWVNLVLSSCAFQRQPSPSTPKYALGLHAPILFRLFKLELVSFPSPLRRTASPRFRRSANQQTRTRQGWHQVQAAIVSEVFDEPNGKSDTRAQFRAKVAISFECVNEPAQ